MKNDDIWLPIYVLTSTLVLLNRRLGHESYHYNDIIMGTIASQITSLAIVYSIVYSDADQRKPQNSALLAFVWGIHLGPVISPHKRSVTRNMFLFDDVIMDVPYKTKDVTTHTCPDCN